MQLKPIQKNKESILAITFYGKNRNLAVLEAQKSVFQYFNVPINYIEWPFEQTGHGQAIQYILNNTLNLSIDYYFFCDMDAIGIRPDFLDIIYNKICDKQSIYGPALSTNHRSCPEHIYAGACFLAFSKQLYLELGRPDMTDIKERSDTGQELTWRCQEMGKNVCLAYPISYEELTEDEMKETGNPKYFELGKKFRYGMSTEYPCFFHGFVQNIKRSNQLFIQKCQEIIGENKKERKIDAIVISVNCSDYLELTLPENIKYFNNYYIGTVATDLETIEICKKYGAIPVICPDPHDINGFKFDKGFCVQECLKQIKDRDKWIILLDADIIVSPELNNLNLNLLNKNTLYGTSRCFAWDYNEYLEYKNGKPIDSFENIPGGWGCGYYMQFYLDAPQIKHLSLNKIYTNGNIETDMHLLEKFHPKRLDVGKLDFKVLHLGGFSLFENGRIENRGRFDCVKGKRFKDIPNVKELLK